MQVHQWEIKTCHFIRKTQKIAISKIIRRESNEKEQKKKSRGKKGIKSLTCCWVISPKSWSELRLQSGPCFSCWLPSLMDEFQRVKKENVVKNNKKIVKTAFRKREKRAHCQRG